jgi:hypothetical protein
VKYVVQFDSRNDNGPMLVGPFDSRGEAWEWVGTLAAPGFEASSVVRPMSAPDICGGDL